MVSYGLGVPSLRPPVALPGRMHGSVKGRMIPVVSIRYHHCHQTCRIHPCSSLNWWTIATTATTIGQHIVPQLLPLQLWQRIEYWGDRSDDNDVVPTRLPNHIEKMDVACRSYNTERRLAGWTIDRSIDTYDEIKGINTGTNHKLSHGSMTLFLNLLNQST